MLGRFWSCVTTILAPKMDIKLMTISKATKRGQIKIYRPKTPPELPEIGQGERVGREVNLFSRAHSGLVEVL